MDKKTVYHSPMDANLFEEEFTIEGGYVVKVAYDGIITGMPEFFDTMDEVEEYKKDFQ